MFRVTYTLTNAALQSIKDQNPDWSKPVLGVTHISSGRPQSTVRVEYGPVTERTTVCQWSSTKATSLRLSLFLLLEPGAVTKKLRRFSDRWRPSSSESVCSSNIEKIYSCLWKQKKISHIYTRWRHNSFMTYQEISILFPVCPVP